MRLPARSDAGRDRGFTLIELLVALTLLAILMTAMLGGLRLG
ncbi:MAG: prepilin-type N-terminal cleavage/methylation domain-containing protein, partial [Geminicoccaceae bacterium]